MKLQNRVALVTGAAGGIGLAIARRFVDEGAHVLLADRKEAELTEAARALGERAAAFVADVTDPAAAQALADDCVRRWGGLDICVCNAGVIRAADFLDLTLEDLDTVMNVNVRGTFLVAQAAARAMVAGGRRNGAIVTLSSMTAELAMPDQLAYGASKGAVRQMTKSMALSLAPHGIRVNAIGPGSIDTEILATITSNPAARRTVLSRIPLQRLGSTDEVAKVAVFLAGDDASYVTGQTVYVDGGRLALNYTVEVRE
ncbi:SDR family NAD(P)-dependent oxidoreductase [Achromobacter deleyi]|uniref:SDR family NAD(P)-dependent oxidoreductase n=1 Tax=Achromobacter deleyi TaxID=1353891 RepID=UPI001492F477|nr:SDR family NAD(P)-dependent oxidoreductase [Achromobacter deleyi]QVQ28920.1 SDR family oxidoreductase [Achromobacter deleyi]UIP19035.1 SDR family oxidoreductase [Achromobacter deleyi]